MLHRLNRWSAFTSVLARIFGVQLARQSAKHEDPLPLGRNRPDSQPNQRPVVNRLPRGKRDECISLRQIVQFCTRPREIGLPRDPLRVG